MTTAGQLIRVQFSGTGGFTDLVFAATALLGWPFVPRTRNLPSRQLHVFDSKCVPTELKGLAGSMIQECTAFANWPEAP